MVNPIFGPAGIYYYFQEFRKHASLPLLGVWVIFIALFFLAPFLGTPEFYSGTSANSILTFLALDIIYALSLFSVYQFNRFHATEEEKQTGRIILRIMLIPLAILIVAGVAFLINGRIGPSEFRAMNTAILILPSMLLTLGLIQLVISPEVGRGLARVLLLFAVVFVMIYTFAEIFYFNDLLRPLSAAEGPITFINVLYLSSVVFTAFGLFTYGPATDAGRMVIVVEVIVGYMIVGLLVAIFTDAMREARESYERSKQ